MKTYSITFFIGNTYNRILKLSENEYDAVTTVLNEIPEHLRSSVRCFKISISKYEVTEDYYTYDIF